MFMFDYPYLINPTIVGYIPMFPRDVLDISPFTRPQTPTTRPGINPACHRAGDEAKRPETS
jgi:hypothetical protein